MVKLLMKMDGRDNLKIESNINGQSKYFEAQKTKMKTTPNLRAKSVLYSLIKLLTIIISLRTYTVYRTH